jgi:WD40 repeat protein
MKRYLFLLATFLLAIIAPVQGQSQILTNFDLVPISPGNAPMLRTLMVEKFAGVEGVLWSPGGTLLAVFTEPGVWLYSYYEEPQYLENAAGTLTGAAFSPRGDTLNVVLNDASGGKIQVWDIATRTSLEVMEANAPDEYGMAYNPDGHSLISTGCTSAAGCRSVARLLTLPAENKGARVLAVSPDGQHVISTAEAKLNIWDVNSRVSLYSVNGHHDEVRAAAFSPDNMQFASGSIDGRVIVRDATSGELLNTLDSGPVNTVAFTPDGSLLAAGTQDGTVRLWNTRTWEPVQTLENLGWVTGIAFSPDGTRLAVGGESVTLWGVKP